MKQWKALALAAAATAAVCAAASASPAGHAVVRVRTTGLGAVLADARGRTLYLFQADKGRRSSCYGACAAAWPPLLTTGGPRAAAGARAGLLGTAPRRDGSLQVTYRGHPLYLFAEDAKAGQTKGENLDAFGGEWYALDRSGREVAPAAAATAPAGGGNSSGGYSSGGY